MSRTHTPLQPSARGGHSTAEALTVSLEEEFSQGSLAVYWQVERTYNPQRTPATSAAVHPLPSTHEPPGAVGQLRTPSGAIRGTTPAYHARRRTGFAHVISRVDSIPRVCPVFGSIGELGQQVTETVSAESDRERFWWLCQTGLWTHQMRLGLFGLVRTAPLPVLSWPVRWQAGHGLGQRGVRSASPGRVVQIRVAVLAPRSLTAMYDAPPPPRWDHDWVGGVCDSQVVPHSVHGDITVFMYRPCVADLQQTIAASPPLRTEMRNT